MFMPSMCEDKQTGEVKTENDSEYLLIESVEQYEDYILHREKYPHFRGARYVNAALVKKCHYKLLELVLSKKCPS